jgi:hypothetical protein
MKTQLLFIIISFLWASNALKAQSNISIEAKGGIVISDMRGNALTGLNSLIDAADGYIKRKPMKGYTLGAAVNIPIAPSVTLQPGLQYTQTGTILKGNIGIKGLDLLGIGASARLMQHKIEIPLHLKVQVAEGLEVMAGANGAYVFDNSLRLRAGVLGFNLLNQKVEMGTVFEPFQVSASAGFQYTFNSGIGFAANYEHGLTRIIENMQANVYVSSAKFAITYKF